MQIIKCAYSIMNIIHELELKLELKPLEIKEISSKIKECTCKLSTHQLLTILDYQPWCQFNG